MDVDGFVQTLVPDVSRTPLFWIAMSEMNLEQPAATLLALDQTSRGPMGTKLE
jgi:hypothetical protein